MNASSKHLITSKKNLNASLKYLKASPNQLNGSMTNWNTISWFLWTYKIEKRFSKSEMSLKTHLKKRTIYSVAPFYVFNSRGLANSSYRELLN